MKPNPDPGFDSFPIQRLLLSILALAAGLSASRSAADPINVVDFSFELSASAPNGVGNPNGTLGGWTYERTGTLAETLTDVTFAPSLNATDGANVAQLVFLAGANAEVTLFQDSGIFFQPNQLYTLTFDVDQSSPLSLLNRASASIYEGANALATVANESVLTLLDGSGTLQTVSLQFATGAVAPAGTLGIGFTIGGTAEVAGAGLTLDNVRLDVTPAPEPSTSFLLAMNAGWFCGRRRRG